MTGGAAGVYGDTVISSYVLGYDFEAFQRVALEAGINTADRSLPISLILDSNPAPQATTLDIFVLADALFYINQDGSMSVSV